ncbi:hypothetical protein TPAR_05100 [Tolypocladium paradoxum]|uniref:Uncharacterized protein n=1 Tax=Tolypocladium paradoxum TaxID=94208 RepID=A0A2S4KX22_9HYPO|nr:hypothetical protein TPAR_05100 [Tolypocladium paradoxum]
MTGDLGPSRLTRERTCVAVVAQQPEPRQRSLQQSKPLKFTFLVARNLPPSTKPRATPPAEPEPTSSVHPSIPPSLRPSVRPRPPSVIHHIVGRPQPVARVTVPARSPPGPSRSRLHSVCPRRRRPLLPALPA